MRHLLPSLQNEIFITSALLPKKGEHMVSQLHNKDFEDIFEVFESYFVLRKAVGELANKIPDLDSREEKIKAYKKYFAQLKKLKELKLSVEDYSKVLGQI